MKCTVVNYIIEKIFYKYTLNIRSNYFAPARNFRVVAKLKHVKSRISLFRAKFDLKIIHYNCLWNVKYYDNINIYIYIFKNRFIDVTFISFKISRSFSKFIIKFLLDRDPTISSLPPYLSIIIRISLPIYPYIHNSFDERLSETSYPDFSRNSFIDAKESARTHNGKMLEIGCHAYAWLTAR